MAIVVWHAVLGPLFVSAPVALSRVGKRRGWKNGRPGPANLLGAVPITAGGALVASTVACHYRAIPNGWRLQAKITPDYLLQDGPYAVSRNPMFIGQATIWAGWAVLWQYPGLCRLGRIRRHLGDRIAVGRTGPAVALWC
ncbi:hypothetical protein [Mycolicibacterium sp. XJ870]